MAAIPELDDSPSLKEFIQAVARLKNNKAAGADSLASEIYKYGRSTIRDHLYGIILKIWEYGKVPQEWRDASTKESRPP
ncbi:unnamed protein product [Arctia plantaginis]|uniref:Uncharacterized protein n=1 Tax=Arctia plantaginis TaxID=874455 RepID=A0A8S1A1J9_ARCPL|nr:unnamed protein product [Arctia plantaginis]